MTFTDPVEGLVAALEWIAEGFTEFDINYRTNWDRKERAEQALRIFRAAPKPVIDEAWQTIESAPRDGTPVLLWKAITEEHYVAAYINGGCGPGWCTPDGFEILTPTYWRPLPDPPALVKEGAQSLVEQLDRIEDSIAEPPRLKRLPHSKGPTHD